MLMVAHPAVRTNPPPDFMSDAAAPLALALWLWRGWMAAANGRTVAHFRHNARALRSLAFIPVRADAWRLSCRRRRLHVHMAGRPPSDTGAPRCRQARPR